MQAEAPRGMASIKMEGTITFSKFLPMLESAQNSICILCGQANAVKKVEQVKEFNILYCGDCALRFSDPMSHPGGAFYEDSPLYVNRASGNVSLNLPALDWRCRTLFKNYPSEKADRMLDIGSGDGGLMAYAQGLGMSAYGIEIDPRGVQIAQEIRGLKNVVAGDLQSLENLKWGTFDRITCFEVMEHLPDPKELLKLIFRNLKPGGLACITVPRWDRNPPLFDPETDFPPHHFTLWTDTALKKVFAQAGFDQAKVFKAPLMIQNFLYLWLAERKAAKATKARDAKAALEPNQIEKLKLKEKVEPQSTQLVPLRVNRRRVAIKAATYRVFNTIDPVLKVFFPKGQGSTLLAVARKPL